MLHTLSRAPMRAADFFDPEHLLDQHDAASPSNWTALCDRLEAMGPRSSAAWAWLERALARWPDPLRRTPLRWLDAAVLAGQAPVCLRLTRTLVLPAAATADIDWLARLVVACPEGVFSAVSIEGGPVSPCSLGVLLGARALRSSLCRLTISDGALGRRGAAALAAVGRLPALRTLALPRCALGVEGARVLVDQGRALLGPLERLDLRDNALDNEALRAILAELDPTCLRELRLDSNPLGASSLDALAAFARRQPSLRVTLSGAALSAPALRRGLDGVAATTTLDLSREPLTDRRAQTARDAAGPLTSLDLSASSTHHRQLARWLAAPGVRGLRRLTLRSNALDVRGAMALRDAASSLRALESLELRANRLGDPGVCALAGASLPALRALDLSRNDIGSAGLAALMTAPWCAQLTSLDLSFNAFERVDVLAETPLRLERLSLRGSRISDAALARLMAAPWFVGLEQLDIGKTSVTDVGIVALTRSPSSHRLRSLAMEGLPDADIERVVLALASSPCLGSLRALTLDDWALSPSQWRLLTSSPYLDDELKSRLVMRQRQHLVDQASSPPPVD